MTPERWRDIERLYHEALERGADERETFLEKACAGDEALRREVKALLAANQNAEGFLDEHALAVEAKEMAAEQIPTLIQPPAIQHFNHYQILSKIGVGGMGEVYLARDTRLERRVAIKVLPSQFTADTGRLQRFTREAKTASSLNHPNIITIYEIGRVQAEAGLIYFIATEFIEGETLRRRMAEGLELREALNIATQSASALDAAHQAGVVHRDIKPENIMVRPDRLVKVLDFGLAKLATPRKPQQPFGADEDTDAETLGGSLKTQPGTILGTLRYMSPEQARGRELDARTDIFSLGVVLYEMITRRPLFSGETSADVIAAIIHKEPEPMSDFASDVPAELERIVRKALSKDVHGRYQTARDLQTDLQTLKQEFEFQSHHSRSGQSARRGSSVSTAKQQPKFQRWPILVVSLLVCLIIAFAVWKYLLPMSKAPLRSAQRVTKLVDERISSGGGISRVEFSPDGSLIAYSISKETGSIIWVKQLAAGNAKQVTDGKSKDRNPIWSPDGQLLAFISDRGGAPGIWSVPYLGGEQPKLLKAIDRLERTLVGWSANGQTIYYEARPNLFALNLTSGESTQITNFDSNNLSVREFRMSPDEEQIAYSDRVASKYHILVVPRRGGRPRQITFGEGSDSSPVWYPDSQRIVFSSNRLGRHQIYLGWIDGREPEQLIFSDDDQRWPTVSPAGNKIISIGERENANIFSCDLHTGKETGHTVEFGIQLFPEVSPDGQQVTFQSSDASVNLNEAIAIKPTDPESKPVQLASPGFNAKWSPKGDALAFLRILNDKADLWKISASGGNPALLADQILMAGQTGIPYYRLFTNYHWSPDGLSIAYLSAKSGQDNLWTVPSSGFPATMLTNNADQKVHIASPFWSPDGRRIAYTSGALPYKPKEQKSLCIIEAGKSEPIFETESPLRLLGWSATGKEVYLAIGEPGPTRPQMITLLKIACDSKKPAAISQISSAYLHSVSLSDDKQQIAVVSRQDGRDNIEIISISTGSIKKATNNGDSTAYYSGITWSSNGKMLFYSRQTSWVLASLIETSEK